GPRDQHAHGLGRPLRRVRDPQRRRRARDPVHHDDHRRKCGAARDPRPEERRSRGAPAAGAPPRAGGGRAGVSRRTLAPFGRRTAEVTGVEEVGAYAVISACDDHGPGDPRPGQFYMLSTAERWGGGADERPYLPRAFSFARVRPDRTLDFMLEAIGPGTDRLASLERGDGLNLVGPLGIGFDLEAPGRPLLVGGGIGAAPLVALQDELGALALLGFRSA